MLVTNRDHGQPRSPGDTAPPGPDLQPPSSSSSSHRPEIRLLAPVLCPECSNCPGCPPCPRGKLCLAPSLCLQSALCPACLGCPVCQGFLGCTGG